MRLVRLNERIKSLRLYPKRTVVGKTIKTGVSPKLFERNKESDPESTLLILIISV